MNGNGNLQQGPCICGDRISRESLISDRHYCQPSQIGKCNARLGIVASPPARHSSPLVNEELASYFTRGHSLFEKVHHLL